jgi:hypothetical protein
MNNLYRCNLDRINRVLEIEIILLLFFRALPPENLDPIDIFTLINPDSIKPGRKAPISSTTLTTLCIVSQ